MSLQRREAIRSFVAAGLIGIYLVSRALLFAVPEGTIAMLWLMVGGSAAAWVGMWWLLRSLAPLMMSLSASSYICAMLIRAIQETQLWVHPMGYRDDSTSWLVAQFLTALAYCLLAYIVWKEQIGHRFLYLHIVVFVALVIVRTIAAVHADLGTYITVMLIRDLVGGALYIALAITFFLHGRQCWVDANSQDSRP